MKSYFIYCLRLTAFLVMVTLLFSCITHRLNTDIPPLKFGSPLGRLHAKTFAFNKFMDDRGTEEVSRNWGAHSYKLDRPASIVVAEAIKKELERNGHKCVSASLQSKSDLIIGGTVKKYWWEFVEFIGGKTFSNVEVELIVSSSSNNSKRVFRKTYEGEYIFKGDSSWNAGYDPQGNLFSELLKQALLRMVGEISTDPELIAFIENN